MMTEALNIFKFIKAANKLNYYMQPENLDEAVENISEIKVLINTVLGQIQLHEENHDPEVIKKLKENLDKYMEILKARKRWNEALRFFALRFKEVAIKALKESKQDEWK